MIIKRNDFLDALRLVKPGLQSSGSSIAFDKGWIQSLSERIGVSYKFETGIEGCLPFHWLYEALKAMKTNGIAVSSDNKRVVFKGGFSELSLNLLPESETFETFRRDAEKFQKRVADFKNEIDAIQWQPVPTRLLEGFKRSLLGADENDIGRLSGILISNNLIVSSDNFRMGCYDMGESVGELIRLGVEQVKALVKMRKSFHLMGISAEQFHLKNDSLIVSLRRLHLKNYPLEQVAKVLEDLKRVKPFYPTGLFTLPAHLEQYVDRAATLAGVGLGDLNFDVQISLKAEGGCLVITGRNTLGELSNKIPWNGVLPELTISPSTLKDILKLTRQFRVNSNRDMVIFEAPNFRFMILANVAKENEEKVV
jgi:hypothetical protein